MKEQPSELERKMETLALVNILIPRFNPRSGYFWRYLLNLPLPSSPPYSVDEINERFSRKMGRQAKLTEDELRIVLNGGDISGITRLGTGGGTFFDSFEVSPEKYVFYIINAEYDRPKVVIDAARKNPEEWNRVRDLYPFT